MKRIRMFWSLGGVAMILFAVGHTIGHLSDPTAGMSPADVEVWKRIEEHRFTIGGAGMSYASVTDTFSEYVIAFTLLLGVESLWTARRKELTPGYLRGRAAGNALVTLALGVITLLRLPILPPIVLSFLAATLYAAAALLPLTAPETPGR